jgi:hypothetical protein
MSPLPASLLLLIPLVGCVEPAAGDPPPPEPPATARWMADVFADRPDTAVGRILLPGAFNSSSYACREENGISPDAPAAVLGLWGVDPPDPEHNNRPRIVAWAKTQDRSLGRQLEDGIRFVEVNVTSREGALVTWHSVYGAPLGDVLDDVVAFSVAQPEEAVVLHFGLTLDAAEWPRFEEALLAPRAGDVSLCDRVYDGQEEAARVTLADVRARGRNLIWSPDGDLRAWLEERGNCPLSRGGVDRIWSITDTPQGVEDAIAGSVDARDPDRLLINDFVFSLAGTGSIAEQIDVLLGYPGVQEASEALGFSGDFPARLIEAYDGGANLNVLAGAYYQDTTLVEAAIARNRER